MDGKNPWIIKIVTRKLKVFFAQGYIYCTGEVEKAVCVL